MGEEVLQILTLRCWVVRRYDAAELVPVGVLLGQEQEGLREVDVLIDVYVLQMLVAAVDLLVFGLSLLHI